MLYSVLTGHCAQYGDGAAHYVTALQSALEPMRRMLQDGDSMEAQPFLGGLEPNYADLAIAGNFLVKLHNCFMLAHVCAADFCEYHAVCVRCCMLCAVQLVQAHKFQCWHLVDCKCSFCSSYWFLFHEQSKVLYRCALLYSTCHVPYSTVNRSVSRACAVAVGTCCLSNQTAQE